MKLSFINAFYQIKKFLIITKIIFHYSNFLIQNFLQRSQLQITLTKPRIGTTAPMAKLQVSGQIVSSVYNAGSSVAIDWNNGNNQYTAPAGAACTAITLTNLQDGGIYRLAVQGVTSGICDFSQVGQILIQDQGKMFKKSRNAIKGTF
mgnify:CR=1 FL=1